MSPEEKLRRKAMDEDVGWPGTLATLRRVEVKRSILNHGNHFAPTLSVAAMMLPQQHQVLAGRNPLVLRGRF